jgi:hypothetical protein
MSPDFVWSKGSVIANYPEIALDGVSGFSTGAKPAEDEGGQG